MEGIVTNRLGAFFTEVDTQLQEVAGYEKTFFETIDGFKIGEASRALSPENPDCCKTLIVNLHRVLIGKQLCEMETQRAVLKNYSHYRSRDWDTTQLKEQYMEQHRRILLLQGLIDRTADLKRSYGII